MRILVHKTECQNRILSNLIMAGVLLPHEVPNYIRVLNQLPPERLVISLIDSHQMLGICLENRVYERRN